MWMSNCTPLAVIASPVCMTSSLPLTWLLWLAASPGHPPAPVCLLVRPSVCTLLTAASHQRAQGWTHEWELPPAREPHVPATVLTQSCTLLPTGKMLWELWGEGQGPETSCCPHDHAHQQGSALTTRTNYWPLAGAGSQQLDDTIHKHIQWQWQDCWTVGLTDHQQTQKLHVCTVHTKWMLLIALLWVMVFVVAELSRRQINK